MGFFLSPHGIGNFYWARTYWTSTLFPFFLWSSSVIYCSHVHCACSLSAYRSASSVCRFSPNQLSSPSNIPKDSFTFTIRLVQFSISPISPSPACTLPREGAMPSSHLCPNAPAIDSCSLQPAVPLHSLSISLSYYTVQCTKLYS